MKKLIIHSLSDYNNWDNVELSAFLEAASKTKSGNREILVQRIEEEVLPHLLSTKRARQQEGEQNLPSSPDKKPKTEEKNPDEQLANIMSTIPSSCRTKEELKEVYNNMRQEIHQLKETAMVKHVADFREVFDASGNDSQKFEEHTRVKKEKDAKVQLLNDDYE
jgi:predicted RND superfamily exporter protein